MKFREWIRAKAVIRELARRDGVSPAAVRASMQEAIDEAWATADPAARAEQLRRFPAGKPTVEAFMIRLAGDLQTEQTT